jgi:hypothetical protein
MLCVQIVNQANMQLEQVGHHVQSVILDTFRALHGVIVMLVQKARKRQAGVCVRRVLQEKQIRQKLSNRAGNVTRASMLKVLANSTACRVVQALIRTVKEHQLVNHVMKVSTRH